MLNNSKITCFENPNQLGTENNIWNYDSFVIEIVIVFVIEFVGKVKMIRGRHERNGEHAKRRNMMH